MIVLRPHKIWSMFKPVTMPTIQSSYQPAWATDGIPGRPVKSSTTGAVITIAGTAGSVDLIALTNHNLAPPATVVLSGDVAGSIVVPPMRLNNIPYGIFVKLGAPVSCASLIVTIASNPTNVSIGEVFAGLSETWDLLSEDNEFGYRIIPLETPDDNEASSVPGYSAGRVARSLRGSSYMNLTEKAFAEDWQDASWDNTRPSLLIPNPEDNDAWAVKVGLELTYRQIRGEPQRLLMGNFQFNEYVRSRG